jgi:hypothetical protein
MMCIEARQHRDAARIGFGTENPAALPFDARSLPLEEPRNATVLRYNRCSPFRARLSAAVHGRHTTRHPFIISAMTAADAAAIAIRPKPAADVVAGNRRRVAREHPEFVGRRRPKG